MTRWLNAKGLLVSALGLSLFTVAEAFVLAAPFLIKTIVAGGVVLTSFGMFCCYCLFKEGA